MGTVAWDSEYNDRMVRAKIEVVQATSMSAIARTILLMEIDKLPRPASAEGREFQRWGLRFLHADLVSASRSGFIEIDGKQYDAVDLPFEVFEDIPFPLLFAWENEVYRCNPDWLPEAVETQKKAPQNSSPASRRSTPRRRTKKASPSIST